MWTFLLPLVLHAIENAPMLLEEAEHIFAELGATDGGVAKLATAASFFADLAERASGVTAERASSSGVASIPSEPTRAVDANGQPISDTQAEMQRVQN